MRAMESTRKKLEAFEEKRFWRQMLLKCWRHQKHISPEAHFIRSSEDHQKLTEVKLQKAVQRI